MFVILEKTLGGSKEKWWVKIMNKKEVNRKKRHFRIRKKISGTPEVPRVNVKRSLSQIYVQVIDDINAKTLVGMGTNSKEVKSDAPYGGNKSAAEKLGEKLAAKMTEQNIKKVSFDRGGNRFHGRVKELADALRKNGIEF